MLAEKRNRTCFPSRRIDVSEKLAGQGVAFGESELFWKI
jgi:hypothetical protein